MWKWDREAVSVGMARIARCNRDGMSEERHEPLSIRDGDLKAVAAVEANVDNSPRSHMRLKEGDLPAVHNNP